ncbi:MAG: hypothetical protein R3E66_02915 [bacterium]
MGLLSSIGNAVSSVSDAFGAVVDSVAGEDSIIGGLADALGVSDVIEFGLAGPGALFEKLCEKLELPEWCGDIASGVANALTGNIAGLVDDALDLSDNILASLGADRLNEFLETARGIGDVAMDVVSGDIASVQDALDVLKDLDVGDLGSDLLLKAIQDEVSLQDLVASVATPLRA